MPKQIEGVTLLTVAEIATKLGVHSNTVRGWIVRGEIPARRIGRRLYIASSAIERILAEAGAYFDKDYITEVK